MAFVDFNLKTHKLLVEAGRQHSETFSTLKQKVVTHWNSSYAMLERVLKNQKILHTVFRDNSF